MRFFIVFLQLSLINSSNLWMNFALRGRITSYNVCYTKLLRSLLDKISIRLIKLKNGKREKLSVEPMKEVHADCSEVGVQAENRVELGAFPKDVQRFASNHKVFDGRFLR